MPRATHHFVNLANRFNQNRLLSPRANRGCDREEVQAVAHAQDDWQALADDIRLMQRKRLAHVPHADTEKANRRNDPGLEGEIDALESDRIVDPGDGEQRVSAPLRDDVERFECVENVFSHCSA